MKQIRVSSLEKFLLNGVRTVVLPRNLLQILATPLVSTASAERSFSILRPLKTYLRTTMETASLAWLLCQCYQPPVNKKEILEDFVASQRRRSDFGDELHY